MATRLARPQPEDFGLSEEDVSRASRPFVAEHRCGLVLALVAATALALFGVVYLVSGSFAAATFFAVILGIASLVLVVPVVMLALSVACAAEERWHARRDPCFYACAAYRAALAEFERLRVARPGVRHTRPEPRPANPAAIQAEVARRLREQGWEEVAHLDREVAGADLLARRGSRSLAVRCEPGPDPASLANARELVAARLDLNASSALLVSTLAVDLPVRAYLDDHGVDVEEITGVSAPTPTPSAEPG